MLLEDAFLSGSKFKLMASQPRRIAASSLMKRLRESVGSKVGNLAVNRDIRIPLLCRTTHGIRNQRRVRGHQVNYFTMLKLSDSIFLACRIFFVTTGYLVRLLAHHPTSFDTFTHLVVDEVHVRVY